MEGEAVPSSIEKINQEKELKIYREVQDKIRKKLIDDDQKSQQTMDMIMRDKIKGKIVNTSIEELEKLIEERTKKKDFEDMTDKEFKEYFGLTDEEFEIHDKSLKYMGSLENPYATPEEIEAIKNCMKSLEKDVSKIVNLIQQPLQIVLKKKLANWGIN